MKISDSKKLTSKGIKNIIFDWGGVITNLDFGAVNNAFLKLGIVDFVKLFSKEYQNKFLVDFEIAQITPEEFRSEIRNLSQQRLSDSEIDEAWNSVLRDTPAERVSTLKGLAKKYNLFLLSNTNSIHVNFYNQKLLDEQETNHSMLFKKVYYSHLVKIRKPDTRIFEHVLTNEKILAEETLFIDDTEMHVDAAASIGINAFHLNIEKIDIVKLFKDW